MDLHRTRRLSETLVISQFRSGRTTSDPKSFFGRPVAIAVLDFLGFVVAAGVAFYWVSAASPGEAVLTSASAVALPFAPLLAVGVVLIAGVMFELTNTARFAGSDAANWLPITPEEYVAASSTAISFSYSPVIALVLGALLPISLLGGVLPAYLLAAGLAIVSLFEGGVLIEMVRAVSQRAGASGSGRHGSVTLVLRVALIVVLILVFDLAFNPVFLIGFLDRFSADSGVTAFVPLLWSSEGLADWVAGNWVEGAAFALGQLGFVALLFYGAARLRERFWVPTGGELELTVAPAPPGHPYLSAVGLSAPESAIVSKDLRGLFRRREMVPMLALPAVLVILLLIEGRSIGPAGTLVWVGWVCGFFALLLATRSVGQERRSFQSLYAFPIRPLAVLRAKAVSVLIPAFVVAAALTAAVAVLLRLGPVQAVAFAALNLSDAALLTVWGLVFAARYSDFQDRPRPQFLQSGAMLGAMGSGMAILFPILLPATIAIEGIPLAFEAILIGWTAGFGILVGAVAIRWTRSGFQRLFEQLPF